MPTRSALRPTLLAALLLVAPAARAQCRPSASSDEARLLAFYAVPLAFSPDAAPAPLAPGSVRVALEVVPVARPDDALLRGGQCYGGQIENTRLAPVFGRPRVSIGLPYGAWVEASWLPPALTFFDAEPSLGGFALGARRSVGVAGRAVTVAARLHATVGHVFGPITCPEGALQQRSAVEPCWGTRPSRDRYAPGAAGVEAMAALPAGRLQLYGGGGYTRLRPRFLTGFTNQDGVTDATRIIVNLDRAALFAGATLPFARRFALSAQLYSVPRDLTTVRVAGGWKVR